MLSNAKDTNMLVYFALGDAKVPNVNGFALQWNVGLSLRSTLSIIFLSISHQNGIGFVLGASIGIIPQCKHFMLISKTRKKLKTGVTAGMFM